MNGRSWAWDLFCSVLVAFVGQWPAIPLDIADIPLNVVPTVESKVYPHFLSHFQSVTKFPLGTHVFTGHYGSYYTFKNILDPWKLAHFALVI